MLEDRANDVLPVGSIDPVTGSLECQQPRIWDLRSQCRAVLGRGGQVIAAGHDERQLTHVNKAWTDEVALSSPERFRFTRAGFEIDGWVMRPAGFVPGRRYPTLLCIHGGPHAQYGHVFFDEFQMYSGAGYAVIFANPRGGQGYGEAFAQSVVGDWGGGDYADVMAAVDEALQRHSFIDGERLGVLGGSYGGFLTSWIVGHTDRFKVLHQRALKLALVDNRLDGEDLFVATDGDMIPPEVSDEFAVRFHLHPAVKANKLTDGHGAMLMLPNRDVWTFNAYEDRVEIEESVYLSGADGPRRAVQIVIHGRARDVPRVHWAFAHQDAQEPVRQASREEPELPL